jgi:hypothetical protein
LVSIVFCFVASMYCRIFKVLSYCSDSATSLLNFVTSSSLRSLIAALRFSSSSRFKFAMRECSFHSFSVSAKSSILATMLAKISSNLTLPSRDSLSPEYLPTLKTNSPVGIYSDDPYFVVGGIRFDAYLKSISIQTSSISTQLLPYCFDIV